VVLGRMIGSMTAAVWSAPVSRAPAARATTYRAGDAELLRRCALGDEAAFATLYDQTCVRLFGLVLRILKDSVSAEQVTQEVYLHVWEHSARYDVDRGSALAWVITTAHRAAVDRLSNGH
jgi:RNA polymerase sigma-70 factor (ECF subfamily)